MKQSNVNLIDWSVLALVIVGAINWGLVGLGHFLGMNLNLVNAILGSVPTLEFAVYLLVGLAGLYAIYFATRLGRVEVGESETEMGERTAAR